MYVCITYIPGSMEVILLSSEVLSESPLVQISQENAARILKVVVPAQHSNAILDMQLANLW